MKLIAQIEHGKYIAEVTHSEIEKFLGLYYGKMQTLKVGAEIDLGKGHDFCRDTRAALEKTEAFIAANREVVRQILDGITVLSNIAPTQAQEGVG